MLVSKDSGRAGYVVGLVGFQVTVYKRQRRVEKIKKLNKNHGSQESQHPLM